MPAGVGGVGTPELGSGAETHDRDGTVTLVPRDQCCRSDASLADSSLYTGAHRERFDGDGRGRGIDGRRMVTKIEDLSHITRSNLSGGTSLTSASRGGGRSSAAVGSSPRCVPARLRFVRVHAAGSRRAHWRCACALLRRLTGACVSAPGVRGGVLVG